jgi:hypothetical protein
MRRTVFTPWVLAGGFLVTLGSANAFSKETIAYVPILELKLPAKPDAHAIDLYQANERLTRPSVLLAQLVVVSDGKREGG